MSSNRVTFVQLHVIVFLAMGLLVGCTSSESTQLSRQTEDDVFETQMSEASWRDWVRNNYKGPPKVDQCVSWFVRDLTTNSTTLMASLESQMIEFCQSMAPLSERASCEVPPGQMMSLDMDKDFPSKVRAAAVRICEKEYG